MSAEVKANVEVTVDGEKIITTYMVAVTQREFKMLRRLTAHTLRDAATFFEAPEDKDRTYHVLLLSIGPSKIGAIKEVRGLTHLGLKEAKELVEKVHNDGNQVAVRNYPTYDDASAAARALAATGCEAVVKAGRVEIRY